MAFVNATADILSPRGHAAKRISILEAAIEVFFREGYSGANIDMIAAEAGVSRQTIYNHHGDKEKLFVSVVRALTERINAGIFATLATFPDDPVDLRGELVDFAVRLNSNCISNSDGKHLRKLIEAEGRRYPELFAAWREDGPGKTWAALAARLARLAHGGHLELDDPDVAARQFLALINAELHVSMVLGDRVDEQRVVSSATNAVTTFLRAYRKRPPGA
ncbi:MAG: TetR/AcrR family transcriptional regulator [Hyphomicrobiales bacterium]|nr:TetR/AcrR family transcriptional regulator [Hyphomicrobiales bacterium]